MSFIGIWPVKKFSRCLRNAIVNESIVCDIMGWIILARCYYTIIISNAIMMLCQILRHKLHDVFNAFFNFRSHFCVVGWRLSMIKNDLPKICWSKLHPLNYWDPYRNPNDFRTNVEMNQYDMECVQLHCITVFYAESWNPNFYLLRYVIPIATIPSDTKMAAATIDTMTNTKKRNGFIQMWILINTVIFLLMIHMYSH